MSDILYKVPHRHTVEHILGPTRQERRETRQNNGRKMLDNRRSVRLLAELSVRPIKKRRRK